MGMLDDLLGGDRDKKDRDEMRENIERIRQKVQDREGGGQRPPWGQRPDQQQGGQGPSRQQPERGSPEQRSEQPSREQSRQRPTPPPGPGESGSQSGGQEPRRQGSSGRDRPSAPGQRPQGQRSEQSQERQTVQQSTSRERQPPQRGRSQETQQPPEKESMPEPPEVKELDIPDIEKGPLFITVEKFRKAIRTIAELEQVANDLESSAASMENTLAEDREMNETIRARLEAAEEKANVVRNIVSP